MTLCAVDEARKLHGEGKRAGRDRRGFGGVPYERMAGAEVRRPEQ
jgi:hypothetical protein